MCSIDALLDNGVVGLILVKHHQFRAGHPYKRIEPVDECDDREKQEIVGMTAADMGNLMFKDNRMIFIVMLADDNCA